ncbi:unnamed protein product, partial [Closterium sp. Naga37s-1]
ETEGRRTGLVCHPSIRLPQEQQHIAPPPWQDVLQGVVAPLSLSVIHPSGREAGQEAHSSAALAVIHPYRQPPAQQHVALLPWQ